MWQLQRGVPIAADGMQGPELGLQPHLAWDGLLVHDVAGVSFVRFTTSPVGQQVAWQRPGFFLRLPVAGDEAAILPRAQNHDASWQGSPGGHVNFRGANRLVVKTDHFLLGLRTTAAHSKVPISTSPSEVPSFV